MTKRKEREIFLENKKVETNSTCISKFRKVLIQRKFLSSPENVKFTTDKTKIK